ncbi:hypothetical protein ACFSJY_18185 [Thalassotalea euphylliae]|uniref:hypothetical protein n=1 Tax=Thalassotalea euphylliae TaxID=1655234 RepID=UPI00362FFFC3
MIEELKQHKLLLAVMGVLIFVKFVLIPVQEWQKDTATELELKRKKLFKAEYMLENLESFQKSNKELLRALSQAEDTLFDAKPDAEFELEQQIALEQLFKKYNLQIDNIGWKRAKSIAELDLKQYDVDVRFSGSLPDAIELTLAIEEMGKQIYVSDYNYTFRTISGKSSMDVRGARLTLSLLAHGKDAGLSGGSRQQQVIQSGMNDV